MCNPNLPTYYSFLLRLWWAKADTGYAWRASVEQVGSGILKGFANPEELMIFLRQLTDETQEMNEKEESNEP
jgi:hypothetical protein